MIAKSELDPENAWQTPPELVERIRTLFGGAIDLDPATTSRNPVQARRCYTPAEDGILMPWAGRIYCNPPYGRTIAHWVDKAITEAAKPGVQVVMLMPARTDAHWFPSRRSTCKLSSLVNGPDGVRLADGSPEVRAEDSQVRSSGVRQLFAGVAGLA